MKKEQYDAMITSINSITDEAKEKGIGRFYTEDESYNGRDIIIDDKRVIHFGSCGYLGLELDDRLTNGAINAIKKYGTFFVCSRAFVACTLYKELEEKLKNIFNSNIILYPKVSQGHWNVMPMIIGANDIVIFDQQAHVSMYEAAYKLQQLEVKTTVLRHNNIADLEQKILEYREKYNRIWYVFDGIYSMFGDSPKYDEISKLQEKYKQLYLYIDDAHGTSWIGKHGRGFALSNIELNERIVLVASMTKAYGATGGVFVIKDDEMYNRVEAWGGSYTYAGPIENSSLGAAIASANIHLSDDIYKLQNELQDKINYCYNLLEKKGIPLISTAKSPIFYIGVGTIAMGYNVFTRLLNDGLYTNMGVYPAVPEACTGIRFTITNHLTYEDIDTLVNAFAYHLPRALQEEKRHIKDVVRAFRRYRNLNHLLDIEMYNQKQAADSSTLTLECHSSITKVSATVWDEMMQGKGAFTADAMHFYEKVFSDKTDKGNDWNFYYYLIKDPIGKIVFASFFTSCLYKEDIMSSAQVSEQIELKRKNDPDYMTTTALMMGSSITNGAHYYLDEIHPQWKESIRLLIEDLWKKQDRISANYLILRDFEPNSKVGEEIRKMGFADIKLEGSNYIKNTNIDFGSFIDSLNQNQRYKIRKEVLKKDIQNLTVKTNKCNENEIEDSYKIYLKTKKKNLSLNTFELPFNFFKEANQNDSWMLIRVYSNNQLISCTLNFINKTTFCAVVFGMDYSSLVENIYKKTLYLTIKQAIDQGAKIVHLGISAKATKHMFGAKHIDQVGYIAIKDNFNAMLLESMEE